MSVRRWSPKLMWMRAESAGDAGPWRQQAILGRGRWEADDLRDIVRDYALETLADADAVLVIDETGFPARGAREDPRGRPGNPKEAVRTAPRSTKPRFRRTAERPRRPAFTPRPSTR